ncbi:hypothetical protein [Pseudomonas weihenstephanensis]|uniref:hypothetical protein n=1 Tax=Pseudomonas weihenstephanensis TaxID=1608994 RepID=UPI000A63D993|nr:hypothetical protein [Pseudomonas weihenstephanensis]
MNINPALSSNPLPSTPPSAPPPAPAQVTDPMRLGVLEQKMAVTEHRLNEMTSRHETVPTRVTKLEGQFEHMAGQLVSLNAGQKKLTVAVTDIGAKVTKLLTILTIVGAVLQMVVPALLRLVFP